MRETDWTGRRVAAPTLRTMYWFLTDETNKPPKDDQFFIYGGVIIDSDRVPEVDAAVRKVRKDHGYEPSASFKFHGGQSGKETDDHEKAKLALLELLPALDVKFAATVVHARIGAGRPINTVIEMGINTMTQAFWEYLGDTTSPGIMLIDRVDKTKDYDEFTNFARRFTEGLDFGREPKRVDDRILLFGMTNNNSSHLSSVVDICLGAFRWCVNESTSGNGDSERAREYWTRVDALIWRKRGSRTLGGYRPRPVDVRGPQIRPVYEQLQRDLRSWSNPT